MQNKLVEMELSTLKKYYHQHYSLTKLEMVGHFSIDSNREYRDDISEIKYIRQEMMIPRPVNMDLNHNIHNRNKRTVKDGRLEAMLHYFKDHREHLDVCSNKPITMNEVPFVSVRGFYRSINKAMFVSSETLRLGVTLANGVIYMKKLNTPYTRKLENMSEQESKMGAWGLKFVHNLVTENPQLHPDISSPVNENSEFTCVFSAKLGRHSLIYGAKVDAFLVDEDFDEEEYREMIKESENNENGNVVLSHLRKLKQVEIKTSKNLEGKQVHKFMRYKAMTWWVQSYFVGCDVIVGGFRDDHGVVNQIDQYKPQDLPKEHAKDWNAVQGIHFCHAFLSFVKQCLTAELKRQNYLDANVRDCPVIDLVFQKDPRSPVVLEKSSLDEDEQVLEEWFLTMLFEKESA